MANWRRFATVCDGLARCVSLQKNRVGDGLRRVATLFQLGHAQQGVVVVHGRFGTFRGVFWAVYKMTAKLERVSVLRWANWESVAKCRKPSPLQENRGETTVGKVSQGVANRRRGVVFECLFSGLWVFFVGLFTVCGLGAAGVPLWYRGRGGGWAWVSVRGNWG